MTLKLRLEFSKTGRARYLSHLDVMRVLQRALTRARAPVAYSEGFNPHMKISVLLPLPLGLESVCEMCDVRLKEDVGAAGVKRLTDNLNAALPEGFLVTGARPALRAASDIAWAAYRLEFERASGFPDAEAFAGLSRGALYVEKKTKRGAAETDIAPFLRGAVWEPDGRHTMRCEVTLPVRDPSLNPEHLAAALRRAGGGYAPDAVYGGRVAVFDSKGELFK